MKLIPNATAVAMRSHSMWSMYLGLLCLWMPELLFALLHVDTNPRLWWVTAMVLLLYGMLGRVIDQGIDHPKPPTVRSPAIVALIAMSALVVQPDKGPTPDPSTVGEIASYTDAEFDALAIPHVRKWEGEHRCADDRSMHCAYLDRIARPPVWTACHGETKGIKRGDRFTTAQCSAMLAREIQTYRAGLHRYFTRDTKAFRLTAPRDVAYASLAYNAGVRTIGNSTATKRLNAGNIRGGCEALAWWNKAGGRVIRGLVNRRAEEVSLCLRGL